MDKLRPEQQQICMDRFRQPPADWPLGMIDGMNEIAKSRNLMNSDDILEAIAEWMVKHPNV